MADSRPLTPPSKAVQRTRRKLSPSKTPRSHTPRFDPDVHRSPDVQRTPARVTAGASPTRRDSFIDEIETRSPVKFAVLPDALEASITAAETLSPTMEVLPDSIEATGVMSSSSLHKQTSPTRIEDSLKAMDEMEDAIDEVRDSLASVGSRPTITGETVETNSPEKVLRESQGKQVPPMAETKKLEPPQKVKSPRKGKSGAIRATSPVKRATSVVVSKTRSTPKMAAATGRMSSAPQATTARAALSTSERTAAAATPKPSAKGTSSSASSRARRPSIAPKQTRASSLRLAKSTGKPLPIPTTSTSRSASDSKMASMSTRKPMATVDRVDGDPAPSHAAATAAARPRPRVASVTKKPFMPTKSAKPPTTSSFNLPGDAIAAKLKARREARQNGTDPSDDPAVPVDCETTVTRAVIGASSKDINHTKVPQALAGGRKANEKKALKEAEKVATAPQVRMTATARARLSLARGEKPAIAERSLPGRPRASMAPTAAGPTAANTGVKRAGNASKASNGTAAGGAKRASASGAAPRNGRADEVGKERPIDRAEAAKRARAEAAERGRLASREWADRMKRRQSAKKSVMDAKPAVEEEKAVDDQNTTARVEAATVA